MATKSTHTQHSSHPRYAPGTSRGPRSAITLLAQVANIERGTRIRARREELHLTQPAVVDLLEEAAEALPESHELHPAKAGKPPVTLRGYQTYEQGGGIVWEKAKLLAQVLQMDVQTMMSGDEKTETPDLSKPAGIAGELASILQEIKDQLAEQTRVLNEIKTAVASEEQAKKETEEATKRLLAAAAVASQALSGGAQPRV